jgi:N-methylhydantoinase B
MKISLITTEIVRNALLTIAEEMQVTLVKTARSTIIKEVGDCSTALHDAKGNQIAQASALPIHLGALSGAAKSVLGRYPSDEMLEGDIFILSGPYYGATHLPDIVIMQPIFHDRKLIAMSGSIAHHQDVGGITPGSMPGNATEIFQEGVIIPPVKIVAAGLVNEALRETLKANIRTPEIFWGDIEAQISAVKIGTRGVKTLIYKYGQETITACMDEILKYTEMRTRAEIREIPNGVYQGTASVDDDGIHLKKTVTVRVAATVKDGDITFDFTGTDAQVEGPINIGPTDVRTSVSFAMAGMLSADIPRNDGATIPFKIILPESSLVNPKHPAPGNARVAISGAIAIAVIKALAAAMPTRVIGGSFIRSALLNVGGYDPATRNYYTEVDGIGGGLGARANKDGISGKDSLPSNALGTPIEALELECPLYMIEQYSLIQDSAGAGKFRGGLGVRKDIRFLLDSEVITFSADNIEVAPQGLFGGKNGVKGKHILYTKKGRRTLPGKTGAIVVKKGDRCIRRTAGGGGYGNPFERNPKLVQEDVLNGWVSLKSAKEDYGCILKPDTLQVDYKATKKLRAKGGKYVPEKQSPKAG